MECDAVFFLWKGIYIWTVLPWILVLAKSSDAPDFNWTLKMK